MKETFTRTICIKLDVDGHDAILAATQRAFNEAASWVASVCWQEGITNTHTAHHRVYGETRSRFGLRSQLAVNARAKAVEAVKSVQATKKNDPACPTFGLRGSIRYDARSFSFRALDRVSLLTLDGRMLCRMILGTRQHGMLMDQTWQIGGADLVWQRGRFSLHVTQHREAPEPPEPDQGTIGVDLGIVNLATASDGQTFTGAQVKKVRARYHRQRQILQKVGRKNAKRHLRKVSGRERRFQKDTNHRISKALVKKAVQSCKALALEDLTGIRERVTVRHEHRYERHSWAFYQLRQFIRYKAAWAGIPVRLIDPRNTSRACSACGHCEQANRRTQETFLCQRCGMTMNADHNAAITISRAAVNQPMASTRAG
jgi:putative transposase